MKIIITAKTEKGKKSTYKDLDKTVDEVIKIANHFNEKRYRFIRPIFYKDATSLIIEKCNTKLK